MSLLSTRIQSDEKSDRLDAENGAHDVPEPAYMGIDEQ